MTLQHRPDDERLIGEAERAPVIRIRGYGVMSSLEVRDDAPSLR